MNLKRQLICTGKWTEKPNNFIADYNWPIMYIKIIKMWSIILLILESLSKIKISIVILNYLQIKLIIYIFIYTSLKIFE